MTFCTCNCCIYPTSPQCPTSSPRIQSPSGGTVIISTDLKNYFQNYILNSLLQCYQIQIFTTEKYIFKQKYNNRDIDITCWHAISSAGPWPWFFRGTVFPFYFRNTTPRKNALTLASAGPLLIFFSMNSISILFQKYQPRKNALTLTSDSGK